MAIGQISHWTKWHWTKWVWTKWQFPPPPPYKSVLIALELLYMTSAKSSEGKTRETSLYAMFSTTITHSHCSPAESSLKVVQDTHTKMFTLFLGVFDLPLMLNNASAYVACRSEICANPKHVSDWHCVPSEKCAILKHALSQIDTVQALSYRG